MTTQTSVTDGEFLKREVVVPKPFSLAQTAGPVAWTTGRSPRHRWDVGRLTWVGWESDRVVWRRCQQLESGQLMIEGTGHSDKDLNWCRTVLGCDISLPTFHDPVMSPLALKYSGLHPYCDGSVFEGIVTAIVGQSISVAAAAVTQAKLAALFPNEVVIEGSVMRPLPGILQLAESTPELVRTSGVTMRRAEALVFAAREASAENLPTDEWVRAHPDAAVTELMKLPMVGRWTAESVVLWGIGAANAHPTGDVALLRAARSAYYLPDLTLKELDTLAERWQPARGLAARLLWTELFGSAPII